MVAHGMGQWAALSSSGWSETCPSSTPSPIVPICWLHVPEDKQPSPVLTSASNLLLGAKNQLQTFIGCGGRPYADGQD